MLDPAFSTLRFLVECPRFENLILERGDNHLTRGNIVAITDLSRRHMGKKAQVRVCQVHVTL